MCKERFLKRRQVENMTGLNKAWIYKLMKSQEFPQSVKIGPRGVRWSETEILEWMEQKKSKRFTKKV